MTIRCSLVLLFAAAHLVATECPADISTGNAPRQIQTLVTQAQEAFQHGTYSQAADRFRQAICYAPQNSALYYGLGLAEAAGNRFDQARIALEQADRLAPHTSHVLLALAQVVASEGNLDRAVRVLADRELLGVAPAEEQQDALQLRARLAQAFLAKNQLELALAQLLRLKQEGELDPATLLTLATLENNLGASTDTVQDADKVINHPSATPAQRAAATAVAGLAFKNLDRREDAIRSLNASIQLQPTEIACLAIADLYNRTEQMTKAADVLNLCASKLPDSSVISIEQGKGLVTMGAYEQAENVLRRLTQTAPREQEAWRWLAQAQTSRGDNRSAVESLEHIARIAPDYPMINIMVAQAILREQNPDYPKALQYLDRASQLSATDPDVYYLRGKTLFLMGRFKEAVQPLEKAVELGPNSLTCYQLGRALHAVGRDAEARQQFERVQLFKIVGQ
jgi:tetratricopeptide (TPR) repeat protein